MNKKSTIQATLVCKWNMKEVKRLKSVSFPLNKKAQQKMIKSTEKERKTLQANILHTWPKTVHGPASGTRRTRINSASFTILSALKYFKYSATSSAEFNCDMDDGVKGADKPVPRCTKNTQQRVREDEYRQWNGSKSTGMSKNSCLVHQNNTKFFTSFMYPSTGFSWPWALKARAPL